jgi:hypothetical protein
VRIAWAVLAPVMKAMFRAPEAASTSARNGYGRRNRRDDLNNRCFNRSGQLFEAQLVETSVEEIT